eukprot:s11065_g1.t1
MGFRGISYYSSDAAPRPLTPTQFLPVRAQSVTIPVAE